MFPGPKCIAYVYRPSETSDGMGGFTQNWVKVKSLKGTIFAIKANEYFLRDVTRSYSTHYFQTTYVSDVNESDRLLIGGEYYEIVFIDNLSQSNITTLFQLNKIK